MADLFVALIHHPVLDRNGRVVTSAITSLDIHDLARSARTYGARALFVVHPVEEQRAFAKSVVEHWFSGAGRRLDSRRREALRLVEIVPDLEEARSRTERLSNRSPLLVYTSARPSGGRSFKSLRRHLASPRSAPIVVMFGTGFGLAPKLRERADVVLEPIAGVGDYNHLSVRAAAAIILDRLRGREGR